MKKIQRKSRTLVSKIFRLAVLFLSLGVLCYGALIGYICYLEVNVPVTAEKADAIIILGAQVQPSGEPSVQLAWRLEAALKAYNENPSVIVVSGGQGGNEPRPEGEVMRDWLLERGVPQEMILTDNTSTSTRENLLHAAELLQGRDIKLVRVVTSDYHLPRALAIARDQGFAAVGTGSPCKQEYWAKNHFREALAWVKYWGQKYLHLPLD